MLTKSKDLRNEFQGADPHQGHFQGKQSLCQMDTSASQWAGQCHREESVRADKCPWNHTGAKGTALLKQPAGQTSWFMCHENVGINGRKQCENWAAKLAFLFHRSAQEHAKAVVLIWGSLGPRDTRQRLETFFRLSRWRGGVLRESGGQRRC